jgi:hypothetical protein
MVCGYACQVISMKAKPRVIPLDKRQPLLWRDLNRWFALIDENKFKEVEKIVPPALNSDMICAQVSRNNAFKIVDDTRIDLNTKGHARGMEKEKWIHADSTVRKKHALRWIKATGKVSGEFVSEVIHQAALENDTKFFRASLFHALKKADRVYRGCVIGAPRCDLAELMTTLWCGKWFRPNWAEPDLPPLCIFSDKAIADLLYLLFPDRNIIFDGKAVEAMRRRLKLIKIQKRNFAHISTVTENSFGRLVFNSDI